MQIINFKIKGFKCFEEKIFKIKDITVLTGSNGTGKSSFIQAILLSRASIDKKIIDKGIDGDIINVSQKTVMPLNGPYLLNLGTVNDIFNDSNDLQNRIEFELENDRFEIGLPMDNHLNDRISVDYHLEDINSEIHFWKKYEFYYLNAERLGSRLGVDSVFTYFPHCYYRGENTADIIAKHGFSFKVDEERLIENSDSSQLQKQIDNWISFICPGTKGVRSQDQDFNRYQITMTNSAGKSQILAPNIGFGISYALPIIVNGLIAKKNRIFIVENPEAHLHPKGQSNMGFFLGKLAASGVRVIVETHSEHIVNGIRKASLKNNNLQPENVGIYFFEENTKNQKFTKEININKGGNLESFPIDFFDQVGQDMAELFKLKNENNHVG